MWYMLRVQKPILVIVVGQNVSNRAPLKSYKYSARIAGHPDLDRPRLCNDQISFYPREPQEDGRNEDGNIADI